MLKQLGPYRIERLLGRGGMGTVYSGVHVETGERAAIKALAITLADDRNFRARFMAEIETLKQLRHPNIVRMIGDGEQDGQLYFVMELVDGQSLQDALQAGKTFDWREVTRIAIEVCAALKHAHDCGIIHRDLKPANLLQTADGRIKLTDFGIAKLLFGATHRTADGSVVGTADYMAPEQADGRQVTNRTDLYSLGAVMFTLLSRRTPFTGGTLPQVIHKLKYEEAPSVCRYAPQTPPDLDHIIAELLRKEPQQRVATALVLSNRLRAMEHAYASQSRVSERVHEGETRVDPAQSFPNEPTQESVEARHPSTKVSPTFADRNDSKRPRDYSWNDATVVTSSSQDGEASSQDGGAQSAAPTSRNTVLDDAVPKDRFTTLEEYERIQAASREREGHGHPREWGSVAGISAAVVLLMAACLWGLLPPSADTLYAKIQRVSSEASPADARREIDHFLSRFPDDPRFQEIDDLRMDVECEWLASRLRLRKRKSAGQGLEPFEERWLEAYYLRPKDPASAGDAFRSLADQIEATATADEAQAAVLAAARHQLKKLEERKTEERKTKAGGPVGEGQNSP